MHLKNSINASKAIKTKIILTGDQVMNINESRYRGSEDIQMGFERNG